MLSPWMCDDVPVQLKAVVSEERRIQEGLQVQNVVVLRLGIQVAQLDGDGLIRRGARAHDALVVQRLAEESAQRVQQEVVVVSLVVGVAGEALEGHAE